MLTGKKSARSLSLFAAAALSFGGALFPGSHVGHAAGAVTDGEGNAAAEIAGVGFAGRAITDTADGSEVKGKKLTLDAAVLFGTPFPAVDVYGGYTAGSGNVTGNKLIIQNGTRIWNKVVGGFAAQGDAVGNIVEISGDTNEFNTSGSPTKIEYVYGGHSKGNGNALRNQVTVDGGTFKVAVVGGRTDGTGEASGNTLTIKKGVFRQGIFGGQSQKGAANDNTIDISSTGGTLDIQYSVTGARGKTSANRNKVKLRIENKDFTLGNYVYGGYAFDAANENTVDMYAGSNGKITFQDHVRGGFGSTVSNGNTVVLRADGGEIKAQKDVCGAFAFATAEGNTVDLRAVNNGKITVQGDVYGAYAATLAKDNTVKLRNATVSGKVFGGHAYTPNGKSVGNTLEVYSGASRVSEISGVQNLHFYIADNAGTVNKFGSAGYKPMLEVTGAKPIRLGDYTIGVGVLSGAAPLLNPGDKISLMKAGSLTADAPLSNRRGSLKQGVTMKYDFDLDLQNNELIAAIKEVSVQRSTQSLIETRAALTDFVNRGADMLAEKGMEAAGRSAAQRIDGAYQLWANVDVGSMRAETGSYVDTKGWNLGLGWARENQVTGGKMVFGPFVEHGRGNYDSYLDDGTHGHGKVSYLGLGVMVRGERMSGLWYEGAVHGGKARCDYRGRLAADSETVYDGSNTYYAASLCFGKDIKGTNGNTVTPYLRYFWSHQNDMDAVLNSGEPYQFRNVDSNRLHLGLAYRHIGSRDSELYAALAWEYEFGGEATASSRGFDIPGSPTLKGSSAMLKLGCRIAPEQGHLNYDFHITGWQGVRHGISGGAQVTWSF